MNSLRRWFRPFDSTLWAGQPHQLCGSHKGSSGGYPEGASAKKEVAHTTCQARPIGTCAQFLNGVEPNRRVINQPHCIRADTVEGPVLSFASLGERERASKACRHPHCGVYPGGLPHDRHMAGSRLGLIIVETSCPTPYIFAFIPLLSK